MSVSVCRSTLQNQQFSRTLDSERSMIVGVHPHENAMIQNCRVILLLRVVVVTINFSRTGSTSIALSKSIPDADNDNDKDDDEDAADDADKDSNIISPSG